jgi:hypothetical protein
MTQNGFLAFGPPEATHVWLLHHSLLWSLSSAMTEGSRYQWSFSLLSWSSYWVSVVGTLFLLGLSLLCPLD